MTIIQNINAPVYGHVAAGNVSVVQQGQVVLTQARQRLMDVFPETVHDQLFAVLSGAGVSAHELLLAQRFGALVARDGVIRRSGKVVDQMVGFTMLFVALAVMALVGVQLMTMRRIDLIVGFGVEVGLCLAMLLVCYAALVPQRTAAKVERFLTIIDKGGEA